MKRLALAAGVALVAVMGFVATPAVSEDPQSQVTAPLPDPCIKHPTPALEQQELADRLLHKRRWRHAQPVAGHRAELREIRSCAPDLIKAQMRESWQRAKRQFYEHRHLMILWKVVWTPFGPYAIPASIVSCESGGDYQAINTSGSGAGGAYQILPSTWDLYNGGSAGPRWSSRIEQDRVAHLIYEAEGSSPWSCAG